jgi:hypothetical protein
MSILNWLMTSPGRLWYWLTHPFAAKPIWADMAPLLAALITAGFAGYIMWASRRHDKTEKKESHRRAFMPALVVATIDANRYKIFNVGPGPAINIQCRDVFEEDRSMGEPNRDLPPLAAGANQEMLISGVDRPDLFIFKYSNLYADQTYYTTFHITDNHNSFSDEDPSIQRFRNQVS